MKNLKTQIESVRDYAYKRLENGDFNVIDCYYDENIESVRVIIEIDTYELNLVMLKKLDFNFMYQSGGAWGSDVILFNKATITPTNIQELVEESLEAHNYIKKELEIKRLERRLKELKNQ